MTALTSTEATVLHVADCLLTEIEPQPFHAVQASTWTVECGRCDDFHATGVASHDDAVDIAMRHRTVVHPTPRLPHSTDPAPWHRGSGS